MSEDRQDQGKRKCPNCGAEVLATDDICMNCGAELVVSPSPEPVEPATPAAPSYAVTQPPREEPVETGKIRVVQALVLSWRGFISHIALLVLGALVMSLMGVCVVLIPPLMAGLYAMSLSAVRGQEPELGDIFGGFSYTVPAYAVVIVMAVIFLVINLLLVAPLVAA